MPTSSIDELLLGGKTHEHPQTPENQAQDEPEVEEDFAPEEPELPEDEDEEPEESKEESQDESEEDDEQAEYDDYGNEKERMSKGLKDRLDRKERQHQREIQQREQEINDLRAQLRQQGANADVQQAAKDFKYDEDAGGDWQQQLAEFVEHTVTSMTKKQEAQRMQQQEAQAQREFEEKFTNGMRKFGDFADVINDLGFDITNPMTLATRSMQDPAAFLYAAAKRNPQELERISKLRDPYAQMAEMGKLEERMRRNKPTTKAPRPISRSSDEGSMPIAKKSKGEPTIEDLIAKSDQKRLARVRNRPPTNNRARGR